MHNLNIAELKHEKYNNVPVFYCSNCLSLAIRDQDTCTYCDKCGSTSYKETDILDWEDLYRDKYKESFIKK